MMEVRRDLFEVKKEIIEGAENGRIGKSRVWWEGKWKDCFIKFTRSWESVFVKYKEFVRFYWGCLHLADVDGVLPLEGFRLPEKIKGLVKKMEETPYEEI